MSKTDPNETKFQRVDRLVKLRMQNSGDVILKKIFQKFGSVVFRRSSAPADYAEILFSKYMKNKGFKTAVEIGCLNGITAAVMTQYVDVVHTFDPVDTEIKYQIWDYLGLSKKIKFHLIKSELEKFEIINNLDFQFAYVDGDHLHCTWSDYLITRKCGRLLLHEARNESSQPNLLINALPENELDFNDFSNKLCCSVYWEKK